jgi:adenylyltransferase/sulfurtransferase
MNDDQLLRYSRQIMLPRVDVAGQQTLLASRALVIGAGGLGSPAAMYLAAAGVGRLVISDPDTVDLSNLQRQLLHDTRDIGRDKVASAAERLAAINPDVDITALPRALDDAQLEVEADAADVVLDCSDNYDTRFAVNRACVKTRTPLVSGAAIRLEGQLAVFNTRQPESPCYHCLYKEGEQADETCSENGVLSPVVGVIGALQALEAIKVLLSLGDTLTGRLLVFDGLSHEWRSLTLPRDPGCSVCAPR